MTDSLSRGSGTVLDRPVDAILGIGYSLLVNAEQTGGAYELMKFTVPGDFGPPPHIHRREDECFYVVDGCFDVMVGDETVTAEAGTYIHLPRGVPHSFRNKTSSMASFLCWVLPGNLAGFFDAFKRPWPATEDRPPPVTEQDIGAMLAAATRYDIQILGGP